MKIVIVTKNSLSPSSCSLGALAGGAVDPDVREYAYKSNFFVLELTEGNSKFIRTA
jgi:hypothetical protein